MKQATPRILITRPIGQHERFTLGCTELGFSTSHLPCLAIEAIRTNALDELPTSKDQSLTSAYFDTILFTSVNAVTCAHENRALPWPGVCVHAIGSSTARALEQLKQPLALSPEAPYDSESYLRQMQQSTPSRLLIIKGVGGRGLIETELQSRLWKVDTIDVYRRVMPDIDADSVDAIFIQSTPDIVSVTSNEILENLMVMTKQHHQVLLNLPLIVNSKRCAMLASSLGFKQAARVAIPAGDIGQLQQLESWHALFQTGAT